METLLLAHDKFFLSEGGAGQGLKSYPVEGLGLQRTLWKQDKGSLYYHVELAGTLPAPLLPGTSNILLQSRETRFPFHDAIGPEP